MDSSHGHTTGPAAWASTGPAPPHRPSIQGSAHSVERLPSRTTTRSEVTSSKSGSQLQKLSEHISKDMLRGVRSERALRKFGAHWSGSVGSAGATPEEEFALSEEVDKINDFITHDWATGRWSKFIALCVIYNLEAAFVASIVLSVFFCITMQVSRPLIPLWPPHPDNHDVVAGVQTDAREGSLGIIFCPCIFMFFLFFWQRIRSHILRRRYILFVDKLCINQTNEELKLQGISSLAGFLRNTDRLVLLWSPRYFSRLWCVYEVAAWVHQGKDLKKTMLFAPAMMYAGVLVMHLLTVIFYVMLKEADHLEDNVFLVVFVLVFAMAAGPIHLVRRLARTLVSLPKQLENFSVRNAECFCCTHGHVHPETGIALPCDREHVYAMLREWFDVGATGGTEACLDAFDKHIHTRFKDAIMSQAGAVKVSYRTALAVSAPSCWFALDTLVGWSDCTQAAAFRILIFHVSMFLFVLPVMLRSLLALCVALEERRSRIRGHFAEAAMTTGIIVASLLCVGVLWLPAETFMEFDSPAPTIIAAFLQFLLTVAVFNNWRGCCRRHGAAQQGRLSSGDLDTKDSERAPLEGEGDNAASEALKLKVQDFTAHRMSSRQRGTSSPSGARRGGADREAAASFVNIVVDDRDHVVCQEWI